MKPLPSDQDQTGRSFDQSELEALTEVLSSGVLFGPKGTKVKTFEKAMAGYYPGAVAIACSSGTAAVHTAVAAIDPEPGDEIITSPITDMGALTPILYQGAVPVFADTDPDTGNLTAETIAAVISERTRAVVVTHLFGMPAEMKPIMELARSRGLMVIEDCAQAFLADVGGTLVGSFGDIACFSLQQGKHITAGEGGLALTADAALAHRMKLFVNKAWDYDNPSDHDFLALNYRMSELQGAVALAQVSKLDAGVSTRRDNAALLDQRIARMTGLRAPMSAEPGSSYWRYSLLVDHDRISGGPEALGAQLGELGVPSAPRYIKKPAFRCGVFVSQKTFGESRWPFSVARAGALDYSEDLFKGTYSFLDRVLVIPWNERYTKDDISVLADAIEEAVGAMAVLS